MSAKRHWFRWFQGAAAFLVLAIVVRCGAWLYEHKIKPALHPAMCKAHLKQLSLALDNYHEHHQRFPPAYTLGSDGKPWHSWLVLILSELGEQELFAAYRFDEPWNDPHNAQLAQRMPEVFGFPGESAAKFLAVKQIPVSHVGPYLKRALDDSPTKRYGPKVQLAGTHHNPTPGPSGSEFLYGHVWVTISWAVVHPTWGGIGLPLLGLMYVRRKDLQILRSRQK